MIGEQSDVRWLHISDLHIKSAGYESDLVTGSLLESIEDIESRAGKIDLVFFTGDVAHSGRKEEYDRATAFFQKLLSSLHLEKSRLFVIPGNHDVDRSRGKGLARTLASVVESDTYFDASEDLIHVTTRQAAFAAWCEAFFGEQRFAKNSSSTVPHLLDIRGKKVAIGCINTAVFCLDDNDSGKLWAGRRSIDALTRSIDATADYKIALMHHPMGWLTPDEQSNIKASLQDTFNFILRGHLHFNDVDAVVGRNGPVVHLAAGAIYQTRERPNSALVSVLSGERLTVLPIKYVDSPRTAWTVDPSLFPDSPDFTGIYAIGAAGYQAVTQSVTKPPSKAELAKQEFERDLFVAPSGTQLYVEPRIMSLPQHGLGDDTAVRTPVSEIVSGDGSYVIETRAEYGASTLSRRLSYELAAAGVTVERRDASDLPAYRKKLEAEFDVEVIRKSKSSVLILDRVDFDSHSRAIKEIIAAGWFSRIIFIVVNRTLRRSNLAREAIPEGATLLHLWGIGREEIRQLSESVFQTTDESFITPVVDKVYRDLLALCIPLAPTNVIMYLRILQREGEFNPTNRVDIIETYIKEVLSGTGDTRLQGMSTKAKGDFISSFVYNMYTKSTAYFDDGDWHDFAKKYQAEALIDFNANDLLKEMIEARIAVRIEKAIALKYNIFYSYFLGRYVSSRPDVLKTFVIDEEYSKVGEIVDVITSISSDNELIVTSICGKLEELLQRFQAEYFPAGYDPLGKALWQFSDDEEERVWKGIEAQFDASPLTAPEVDKLKTSLIAEARTADQETRFVKFTELESALFTALTFLAQALRNADDVSGSIKLRAYQAMAKAQLVAFQIGTLLAPVLAKSKYLAWGGVAFIDFHKAGEAFDRDSPEAHKSVIIALCESTAMSLSETLGTHKLGPVFKMRQTQEFETAFEQLINFYCVLSAKGVKWAETLEKIIEETDKNSFYLRALLGSLMRSLRTDVLLTKDRDATRRLVALVRAKRTFGKQAPGARAVGKMMDHLKKIGKL